jgi:hypothetical protein
MHHAQDRNPIPQESYRDSRSPLTDKKLAGTVMGINEPAIGPARASISAGLLASPACRQEIEELAPQLHFDLFVNGRVVGPVVARTIWASKFGPQLLPCSLRHGNHALEQLCQVWMRNHVWQGTSSVTARISTVASPGEESFMKVLTIILVAVDCS